MDFPNQDLVPAELPPSEEDGFDAELPELDVNDEEPGPASAAMGAVYDIPVKVQAVLGGARMPINELLRMKSGAVIELDRRVGEPVDVLVNDRLIARGELVLIDGSLGLTLTEIVKQER